MLQQLGGSVNLNHLKLNHQSVSSQDKDEFEEILDLVSDALDSNESKQGKAPFAEIDALKDLIKAEQENQEDKTKRPDGFYDNPFRGLGTL